MKTRSAKKTAAPKSDAYERVTAKIVEQLENGVRPWMKPWADGGVQVRPLRENGVPYRGVNTLALWLEAQEKGYSSPFWMTYNQAQELGGQVRKGEKSTTVFKVGTFKTTEEENGEEVERSRPFMKSFAVFNANQVDGLPERFQGSQVATDTPTKDRIENADRFFAATGADIRHGGNRAFYSIVSDHIGMPTFDAFVTAEDYAGTLAHELMHWTRHPTRLDRDLGRKKWGDEGYAREELVAEIGSAFLAADLGFEIEPRADHAAYLDSWLKVLKGDKRAIFSAAALAEKACDFLHKMQPGAKATDEDEDDQDEEPQALAA